MSKGMYCSASQWIDSASSSCDIGGRVIFFTITALPETEVATSAVLIFWVVKSLWMASITAPESMMAPSTMASGGRASMPRFRSWYSAPPLPPAFSSTALIAEDPMSTPTSPFFLPNRATSASFSANDGCQTPYRHDQRPDPEAPQRNANLQRIVKVLHEASRRRKACQAKNEGPWGNPPRTLDSGDLDHLQSLGARGQNRILTAGSSLAWMVSMKL